MASSMDCLTKCQNITIYQRVFEFSSCLHNKTVIQRTLVMYMADKQLGISSPVSPYTTRVRRMHDR